MDSGSPLSSFLLSSQATFTQPEQPEQLTQFLQFTRLSKAFCAASFEPKYSTLHLLPLSSLIHVVTGLLRVVWLNKFLVLFSDNFLRFLAHFAVKAFARLLWGVTPSVNGVSFLCYGVWMQAIWRVLGPEAISWVHG